MTLRMRAVPVLSGVVLLACHPSRTLKCPSGAAVVLVDATAHEHELALCENGVAVNTFHAALGRGGTGKTTEGDNKTPLGVYPLSTPGASGYPTREQAVQVLTGTDLGIQEPAPPASG
jgi:L,D-peptidoglycan transpeptidase YkuD (ErfK/YbiS/YcfS/YnhG family)